MRGGFPSRRACSQCAHGQLVGAGPVVSPGVVHSTGCGGLGKLLGSVRSKEP